MAYKVGGGQGSGQQEGADLGAPFDECEWTVEKRQ